MTAASIGFEASSMDAVLKAQQVGLMFTTLSPKLNRNSLRHLLRAAALTAASIRFEASSMDPAVKAAGR
ncbi:hypothetical protein [Legionella impletisoli]|uniref:hypothetical protein n=2 Tax=Legionella impletisoli TaxID=343510 RepID=UPI0013EF8B0B|nr:hypothetical protein [Legionella impletisoli]